MNTEQRGALIRRATVHAALGDPARLAIVDALMLRDASPSELLAVVEMPSNLLAHHLKVLERAGVIRRSPSEADRRRTYVGIVPGALDGLVTTEIRETVRVVFVCTENSARSQLAAALWAQQSPVPVTSAGTHPARRVHPGAVAAARRHDLPMSARHPQQLGSVIGQDDLVVTVCDRANESLQLDRDWLHWSVPDPSKTGDESAFDHALTQLTDRVSRLSPVLAPPPQGDQQ